MIFLAVTKKTIKINIIFDSFYVTAENSITFGG
jgi:hypothetical protein